MRDWSPTLIANLASLQVTRCFLIEMVNPIALCGTVRLTDFDQDRVVGGNTFLKSPGFNVTKFTVSNGGRPAGLDIDLPFDSVGPVYADHVKRGAWRGVPVTVWLADFTNPSDREIVLSGFVGETEFTDRLAGSFKLITKADALADIILFTVQPKCSFRFGSSQCGVDLTPLTLPATVATVTNNGKFTITVTNPSGLNFTHGKVVFTGGDNAGWSDNARRWVSGTSLVELVLPAPFDVQVGDTINISAGCDLSRSGSFGCKHYNNVNRYPGFDFTPGELLS
ncbi:DUF2163 domain-containing protein [Mesorhizobium sp. M4A.F.Ca.ET.090.04.2.1]|uniref:DUF2163 domain-containing protein n=1 Tax=Mesorhizobium sp. M4A.F.Ca.ET.090.04.2.1 TaxID=2496663 RepID=UPI000FCA5710|nr:DUF2163 domain-containing protein [Mesorhizobium sp. M4A.F.Ca.ET.090.04.2.1]RVC47573.1 DUF2163 domain-containing protein [Mesorhizobium sp. M4A.F.Ca.ET.090.04.2.1]